MCRLFVNSMTDQTEAGLALDTRLHVTITGASMDALDMALAISGLALHRVQRFRDGTMDFSDGGCIVHFWRVKSMAFKKHCYIMCLGPFRVARSRALYILYITFKPWLALKWFSHLRLMTFCHT